MEDTVKSYEASSEQRAENLAAAFERLQTNADYGLLLERIEGLLEDIKEECIRMQDLDGVRWYQAEFSILETILRRVRPIPATTTAVAEPEQEGE